MGPLPSERTRVVCASLPLVGVSRTAFKDAVGSGAERISDEHGRNDCAREFQVEPPRKRGRSLIVPNSVEKRWALRRGREAMTPRTSPGAGKSILGQVTVGGVPRNIFVDARMFMLEM